MNCMAESDTLLPKRRAELVVDDEIVLDRCTGELFNLGPTESFLLTALDGNRTAVELTEDFENRFGEPLPYDHLQEFLELVRSHGLLDDGTRGDEPVEPVVTEPSPPSRPAGPIETTTTLPA